ncbi:cupin [Sphingomonas sp. GCM10030256]|uniref:cupin n=1 Tax=Sphingomonas sp. GCM10030256 TaxID=3273427 RepID=UPI003619488F
MRAFDTRTLMGPVDWSGPTYSGFGDASVKLRWIKDAYKWHINDGPEVFLVLDGIVDMHVRSGDREPVIQRLSSGQMIFIEDGEEHIAYPCGDARILVVERADRDTECAGDGAEH